MLKIKLIVVGSIKEKYFTEAVAEYKKRLSRFCSFEIVEVPEYLQNSNCTNEQIINAESAEIMKRLDGFVIAFDLRGKEFTSEELAGVIKDCGIKGESKISFVIGGSYGMNSEIIKRASLVLRVGKATFPHQLMRVMAAEQIYRAMTIINNVKYHK